MNFSSGLPMGCQKVPMHPNSHGKKYWFVEKKALQETNDSDIDCKFSSSLV